MYRRTMWPGLAILATAALAPALIPGPALAQATPPGDRLDAVLKPYLASHTLPAIAAAVVRNGVVIASGAVGTRRVGADIPVTINDRFHIGSDTKAMTALLAGMYELSRVADDSPAWRSVYLHMGAMSAALLLYAISLFARLDHAVLVAPGATALACSAFGLIALATGGWLGGKLVYEYQLGGAPPS